MNIDHTLAIILAVGMLILLIVTITWVVLLVMITLGVRRAARQLETASTRLSKFTENPTELLVSLFRRRYDSSSSNDTSNVSKWWKRFGK